MGAARESASPTEAHMTSVIDGQEVELRLFGECGRDITGHVTYANIRALDPDGVDRFAQLSVEQANAVLARIWCQYLADTHPFGDSVEAV